MKVKQFQIHVLKMFLFLFLLENIMRPNNLNLILRWYVNIKLVHFFIPKDSNLSLNFETLICMQNLLWKIKFAKRYLNTKKVSALEKSVTSLEEFWLADKIT